MTQYVKTFLKKFFSKTYNRAVFLLIVATSIAYIKAFFGYFQGDEWPHFAAAFTILDKPYGDLRILFDSFLNPVAYGAHFFPVLSPISYIQLKFFGTNFFLYQLLSFSFHIGIVLCVFYFAYLFSKQNLLFSFLAGLFFGLSAVHFHAVSWISAVGVQIALFFSLLSLIFLKLFYLKKISRYKTLSLLFLVLAVFSKETAFFLLIIYPLITFFSNKNKWGPTLRSLKSFGVLVVVIFAIEAIFRVYTYILNTIGGVKSPYTAAVFNSIDATLIYKAITWLLKSITQTFIPAKIIYLMGEKITIWGFPHYAQEASVHGTNFLAFAQSAGAEFFVYATSVLIILGGHQLYKFFAKRDKVMKQSIMLGIMIIVFNVVPLIFIVNALINKFGYVTLFDSRHIYSMSLGGSLIFAAFFVFLYRRSKILFFPLLIIWSLSNFYLLDQTLSEYALMGYQRKTILNKILTVAPVLEKKSIVLVKSNVGYYGFGLMPPFQTNLGQILTFLYYQKKQLPREFIESSFFPKKGIAGEGYVEYQDRGFGYYIEENKMMTGLINGLFKPTDIYAFFWDGTKNQIEDITSEIRQKAYEQLYVFSKVKDWNIYEDKENKFSFRYPVDMQFRDLDITNKQDALKDIIIFPQSETLLSDDKYEGDGLYLRITLSKKPETLGINAFASPLKDSDGNTIGSNFTFRDIVFVNGSSMMTIYIIKGKYVKYFFDVNTHDKEFEISAFGKKGERVFLNGEERYNEEVERILSTFYFWR